MTRLTQMTQPSFNTDRIIVAARQNDKNPLTLIPFVIITQFHHKIILNLHVSIVPRGIIMFYQVFVNGSSA